MRNTPDHASSQGVAKCGVVSCLCARCDHANARLALRVLVHKQGGRVLPFCLRYDDREL